MALRNSFGTLPGVTYRHWLKILNYYNNGFIRATYLKIINKRKGIIKGILVQDILSPQTSQHKAYKAFILEVVPNVQKAIKLIYCPWTGGGIWIIFALPKSVWQMLADYRNVNSCLQEDKAPAHLGAVQIDRFPHLSITGSSLNLQKMFWDSRRANLNRTTFFDTHGLGPFSKPLLDFWKISFWG